MTYTLEEIIPLIIYKSISPAAGEKFFGTFLVWREHLGGCLTLSPKMLLIELKGSELGWDRTEPTQGMV